MKNFLKEYFAFTRSERKGIIVLVSVIFILTVVWKLIYLGYYNNKPADFSSFEKDIKDFKKGFIKADSLKEIKQGNDTVNFFPFDPNLATDSDWVALGLKEFQIKIIRNYLAKGGRFKVKEDLKKIWGIKPEQYLAMEPYIEIPPEQNKTIMHEKQESRKIVLSEFDPNCVSADDWRSFGLSDKQIKVIENFIAKGGKFRSKDDFKKMYCITLQQYELMEPYIRITNDIKQHQYDPSVRLDINIADSADFRKLKGISPYVAGNIVKYRNALGGFINKQQLLEVWGIKKDTYSNIEQNFFIGSQVLKKLNINTASFSELAKHPYLNYDATKAIVKYRKIMNRINTIDELVSNKIIPDTLINKLKPYVITQ